MSVFDAHVVLQALINLNQWEDELKALGPRTARKAQLDLAVAAERPKVAPFILAHHDRIRARGRSSTAPVRDWICRSCFISVPIGLRTKLSHRDDICVCENCGAYIFLPTPEQQVELEASEARKRQLLLDRANKAADAEAAARPRPKAPTPPAAPVAKSKKSTKPTKAAPAKATKAKKATKPAKPLKASKPAKAKKPQVKTKTKAKAQKTKAKKSPARKPAKKSPAQRKR